MFHDARSGCPIWHTYPSGQVCNVYKSRNFSTGTAFYSTPSNKSARGRSQIYYLFLWPIGFLEKLLNFYGDVLGKHCYTLMQETRIFLHILTLKHK